MENVKINIQETQQSPSKINSNKITLTRVIIKLLKDDRILKTAREKLLITYKGPLVKLSEYFSYL